MKVNSPARIVAYGGILTALSVLFHSAPVFLPGIGLALSPFATLSIALAAVASTYSGVIAWFASAIILLLISPQEAVIFLLTTGPLGLVLGAGYNKRIVPSAAAAGGTLFVGINLLKHVAGIAVFGSMTPNDSLLTEAFIFLLFAAVYSIIWLFILRLIISLLLKTGQFEIFTSVREK